MAINVLHLVESLKPTANSVAVVLPGLFKTLHATGCTSSVVTNDRTPPTIKNADVAHANSNEGAAFLRNADIVHVHGAEPQWLASIPDAILRTPLPRIVSPLGAFCPNPYDAIDWRTRMKNRSLRRRATAGNCLIAATNDAELNWLRSGMPGATSRLLPYGIDFDSAHVTSNPISNDSVRRFVLLAAPIHPIEGIVPLLRALAELGHDYRHWHVIIAGPACGDWQTQINAALARKGFSNRATIVADPDDATQRRWMANASILIAPSLRVRPSFSALQAIAASVPVIAVRDALPGQADDVVQIIPPTRDGLREILCDFMDQSDETRCRTAAIAREQAKRRLDWTCLVDDYVQTYQSRRRSP